MLKKNNIHNYFTIFLSLHLVIWTLVPTYSNINLPLDTIEALAWGSNLEWGFNKHPPMSAFVVEFFFQLFGNQDWAYYFLSQICIVISFIFIWKLSNNFFKDKIFSLLSVLILEGIVFLNYTTPEFNVYVCQLPFKVLSVYYCWKCTTKDKTIDWILLGIFSALGFLTHYSFVFLMSAIIIFFIIKILKEKKINYKYLISILTFFLFITPHLIWLYENDFITITYAFGRTGIENKEIFNHVLNPLKFIVKQFGMLIPLLFMFLIIFSKKKNIKKINFIDKKLLFLVCINIIPIIFIFLISFLTGAKIRTMWMSTFYLFFGILLFYFFKSSINLKKINNFIFIFIFLFFLSPITYFYISSTNDYKRTDYPGKEIARLVKNKWDQNFSNEILIVVGDEWFAGNLSYHLASRPKWFISLEKNIEKINNNEGVIYVGNPKVLKKLCPGVFGKIDPVGYCMIGKK
jgi:4-amino-4-deoxy-L-arabinose transferase-like glycosyltransferase